MWVKADLLFWKIFKEVKVLRFVHTLYERLRSTLENHSSQDIQMRVEYFQLFQRRPGKVCKHVYKLPIRFGEILHASCDVNTLFNLVF